MKVYDVIIIGCGPAGLTAGIYAGRRNLKTLLIGESMGGQQALAHIIENYPGIESISGMDLTETMKKQCENFGCEIKIEKVIDMELEGEIKKIKTGEGVYESKTVVLATGEMHRKLNVKGEDKFLGKGVSYCPTCDGPIFKGKKVAVIGGSDSAVTAAVYLSEIASETYLIHRRDKLRAEEANQEQLFKTKTKIIWDTTVNEIQGDNVVKKIKIKNVKTNEEKEVEVDGVFIEVGMIPSVEIAKKSGVEANEKNYIKVNRKQETNIKGVYAAGDITGALPQIISAGGEGATAATNAYFFLKGIYGRKVDWGEK